jgi:hypothetical protein
VILVTHALHFLPQVDFVYTVVNGRIAEQGPYDELIKHDGPFAKLVADFGGGDGGLEEHGRQEEDEEETELAPKSTRAGKEKVAYETLAKEGTGKLEGRLMRAEKRTIGSVSMKGLICSILAFSDNLLFTFKSTCPISALERVHIPYPS